MKDFVTGIFLVLILAWAGHCLWIFGEFLFTHVQIEWRP